MSTPIFNKSQFKLLTARIDYLEVESHVREQIKSYNKEIVNPRYLYKLLADRCIDNEFDDINTNIQAEWKRHHPSEEPTGLFDKEAEKIAKQEDIGTTLFSINVCRSRLQFFLPDYLIFSNAICISMAHEIARTAQDLRNLKNTEKQDCPEFVLYKFVMKSIILNENERNSIAAPSVVYEGFYENKHIALKLFADETRSRDSLFRHEWAMSRELTSEFVVPIIGVSTIPKCLCIATEYVQSNILAGAPIYSISLTTVEKLRIAIQISRGLQFFHSKKIIFRNLTSSKIVLDLALNPKFVGLSCCDFIGNSSKPKYPNLHYLAPEQLDEALSMQSGTGGIYLAANMTFTEQADVFACGLVLCEIFSQKKHKVEFAGLIDNIQEAEKMLDVIINLRLKTLLQGCLHVDPSQRTSLATIISTLEEEITTINDAPKYIQYG